MSGKIDLHFGGLWEAVNGSADDMSLPPALHFFGTNYLVFLEFEKPNRLIQGIFQYVLSGRSLSLQSLDQSAGGENPIMKMSWRFIDNQFLELNEDGKKSVWEPTTVQRLVEIGYPIQVFQSLRKSFNEEGVFYSEVPLIPDPSAFPASNAKK